jgi:16S rRNA (guanine1207-N2)-methyltransferase
VSAGTPSAPEGDRPGSTGAAGDPYLRTSLGIAWGGNRLRFRVPHSVFSSQRIDDGTRLLLDRLPPGEPRRFLDLGCGYGALGLPVAARFPNVRGLLVDRDLLAVEYCRRNAELAGLGNVEVTPSLGYGSVPPGETFDWILVNVPARAGGRVHGHFLAEGIGRLAPGGSILAVVIAPLAGALEDAARARGIEVRRAGASDRHVVFAASAAPGRAPTGEGLEVYGRDAIEIELPEKLRLLRPTDLADEPHRLPAAIPLLASRLPETPPARVLVFRPGYGLVPALALARWPAARVVALDRDLLGIAYTKLNGASAADRLETIDAIHVAAAGSRGPFDLVLGELSPPNGPAANIREVEEARSLLASGGRALILGLLKQWRETLGPRADVLGLRLLESREAVALIEARG